MPDKVDYLDCCTQPALETVKSLYDSSHDTEAVRQCQHCQAYWFYRFHEYVSFITDDEITVWYSRLTPEEARGIIDAKERPDLSFQNARPSFVRDHTGVHRTSGQPDHPWA